MTISKDIIRKINRKTNLFLIKSGVAVAGPVKTPPKKTPANPNANVILPGQVPQGEMMAAPTTGAPATPAGAVVSQQGAQKPISSTGVTPSQGQQAQGKPTQGQQGAQMMAQTEQALGLLSGVVSALAPYGQQNPAAKAEINQVSQYIQAIRQGLLG